MDNEPKKVCGPRRRKRVFGEPDRVTRVPDTQDLEAWLYFEEPFKAIPRLSLVFDKKSESLVELNWQVREGEKENKLSEAMGRISGAKFIRQPQPKPSTHYVPDRTVYADQTSGYEIVFRQGPKRVDFLSWVAPDSRYIADSSE